MKLIDVIQKIVVEIIGTVLLVVSAVTWIIDFVVGDLRFSVSVYVSAIAVSLLMIGFPSLARLVFKRQ